MNAIIKKTTFLVLSLLLVSCGDSKKEEEQNKETSTSEIVQPVETVLTQEQQQALTPVEVIQRLKDGNLRFVTNDRTSRNHSAQIRNSITSQFPKAIILSCVDSRVPIEDVFDQGIGDLFVARIAGNFANTDILGSMEFACNVSGSKVILVLGHEHCGAIRHAIMDTKLGNITSMLANIRPAVNLVTDFEGERVATNQKFVHEVCISNIKNTINYIRDNSVILKRMEKSADSLKIIGAVYNMSTGELDFME
ncbi:carbonic anhydrase [Flavobacterium jejuense]|uniref:Carbonic anhydrase n=1 Tax=Flavobacterium jejuense TaxID=1544455 RepID=A0ABX0IQG1_9FLAO|nr:carbonic anhydrase family protein [Flavobacterium jejuense]NHN25039.1 carbonic anhydrase [Flavobacterium jejuense]